MDTLTTLVTGMDNAALSQALKRIAAMQSMTKQHGAMLREAAKRLERHP
jgi:hypothetical protein